MIKYWIRLSPNIISSQKRSRLWCKKAREIM